MNIFTKFQKDWTTIVDFLLIAKFLASAITFCSPSIWLKIANLLNKIILKKIPVW